MQAPEVQDAVRAWMDAHSVNPATGVAPDAKVGILAHRITTFGETRPEGETRPDAPAGAPTEELWSVTATLYFPNEEDELRPKIMRILDRFRDALPADASLADGARLEWRGTGEYPFEHLDAPDGYPSAVDVLFAVRAPRS